MNDGFFIDILPIVDGGNYPVKIALDEPFDVVINVPELPIKSSFCAKLNIQKAGTSELLIIPMIAETSSKWHARHWFSKSGVYYYNICTGEGNSLTNSRKLQVWVEPVRTRVSSWYERFPRSSSETPGKHATFTEFKKEVVRIAALGFDTIYIPPIHPIGRTCRKGKNGNLCASTGDVGCVWAVGNEHGGHKSVDPSYGTLDDFSEMVSFAKMNGVEIALDIALHCSPDHPYVKEHPEWFFSKDDTDHSFVKDGVVEYRDIVPFNFECNGEKDLWNELKSIFDFWIAHGISVFRIDNPHTKPLRFWKWVLEQIKIQNPDVVFLSEALTTPDRMHDLAKAGMSQTYDYFQWKSNKSEITDYYNYIFSSDVSCYFKPVLWTNTPQNLPVYLQHKTRASFIARLILAATIGSSYGIYGPPFEYCYDEPLVPGSVDYPDSEQFEIPEWTHDTCREMSSILKTVNMIRKTNSALQNNSSLVFHETDNINVIAYSKCSYDGINKLLMIVNLDPETFQSGYVVLNDEFLVTADHTAIRVHDLLYDKTYFWQGRKIYFQLQPDIFIAHIMRIEL